MATPEEWRADDHDHGPTAQLLGDAWCLTCQHTHIATIPVTTFRCAGDHQGCGFGCWGVTVAAAHAEQYPEHVVYPQLHQMVPERPADTAPAETLAEVLSVPSEQAMFDLLTALNVSGIQPELPCVRAGTPFLATLTDPDAGHVHIIRTGEDGRAHCCQCSHDGGECTEFTDEAWPNYPVLALVTDWPDVERVAEEDYIDPWWLAARVEQERAGEGALRERVGLGNVIVGLLDEHWPNCGVNGWYLADLIHGARAGEGALRERVAEIADDLWRVGCDCGHRADLHMGGHDSGCTGGLTLCPCRRSFTTILSDRLRAVLAEGDPT